MKLGLSLLKKRGYPQRMLNWPSPGFESVLRIEVVRERELKAGYVTEGTAREKAFESENFVVSRTRVAGGGVSVWHHHGARHLCLRCVGSPSPGVRPGGKSGRRAEIGETSFMFHLVSCTATLTRTKSRELVVVNILVGKGEPVVNLQRPQGEILRRQ